MFAEAREHDGFDPNTMFSQGVDLNESYDGSPALRRNVVGPGVDCQASSRNLFDEQASGVFNGSQV